MSQPWPQGPQQRRPLPGPQGWPGAQHRPLPPPGWGQPRPAWTPPRPQPYPQSFQRRVYGPGYGGPSGFPPPQRGSGAGRGCAVAALVGVGLIGLVMIVGFIGILTLAASLEEPTTEVTPVTSTTPVVTPTPTPTTTKPTVKQPRTKKPTKKTKKPTKKATKKPTKKSTYKPKGSRTLWANAVYRQKMRGACPSQAMPGSYNDFKKRARALVRCQEKGWKRYIQASGYRFQSVGIYFYNKRVTSPCGTAGPRFPAFYCSANRVMYFSTASYKQSKYFRLSLANFVFHEYGHHVQHMTGILSEAWYSSEASTVSRRRIELQAFCLAHYGLRNNKGINVNSRDRYDLAYQWDYASDPVGHGSAKAQNYWGPRGLRATRLSSCSTFNVPASKVK